MKRPRPVTVAAFLTKDIQLMRPLEAIRGKAFERVRDALKALRKFREISFGFGDRGHASAPYYLQQNGETHSLFARSQN